MCIRDRVIGARGAEFDAVILPEPGDGRIVEDHFGSGRQFLSLIHISEPHETVLDLVCRLLLEKKNNA